MLVWQDRFAASSMSVCASMPAAAAPDSCAVISTNMPCAVAKSRPRASRAVRPASLPAPKDTRLNAALDHASAK